MKTVSTKKQTERFFIHYRLLWPAAHLDTPGRIGNP